MTSFQVQVVVALAAVAAAFAYFRQNHQMTRARRAELLFFVFQQLQSPDARRARSVLYSNTLTPTQLDTKEHACTRWDIEEAAGIMQSVAVLIKQSGVEREFIENWGDAVVRVWDDAEGWVRRRRARPGDVPYLFDDFEKLAEKCRAWQANSARVKRIADALDANSLTPGKRKARAAAIQSTRLMDGRIKRERRRRT